MIFLIAHDFASLGPLGDANPAIHLLSLPPAGPLALHGHAFKLNISDKQNSLKVQLENRK